MAAPWGRSWRSGRNSMRAPETIAALKQLPLRRAAKTQEQIKLFFKRQDPRGGIVRISNSRITRVTGA
jgi:hypothetical protein